MVMNQMIELEFGTLSLFGESMKFDLSDGFPIITTRKIPLRIAFEETMFFLRGETDTKKLEEKKINIWKGNTSREFLDNIGHEAWAEGEIGPGSYGALWRGFPYNGGKIDQVKVTLDAMKNNPESRRHLISAWHPQYSLTEAALPACHMLYQYGIKNNKLHSTFYMRSSDFIFGAPFNICGYALMQHIFAKYLNLDVGTLTYCAGDVHIYNNQISIVKEMVKRVPKKLPILIINKELNIFEDILSLEFSDIKLEGYEPYPDFKNKPPMAV